MLSDDEACRLLSQAGETVTVDPAAPIPDHPRRSTLPILAAAAVVMIIAAVAAVLGLRGTQGEPTPTPPAPDAESVQIPSVLGYDLNGAADALRDVGLSFRTELEYACNTTYVRGTVPAAGTPVEPGAEVVVRYATATDGFCVTEEQLAVDLLALADGRGEVPPLARDIAVYDASGPTDLDTVLDRLSAAAHAYYPSGATDEYLSPTLVAKPLRRCVYPDGPRFEERDFVRVGVLDADPNAVCPDFVIDVYRTGDAIDALVLRTILELTTTSPDPEPTIGTAFRDFARGGDLPPVADEVSLYLGNAFTGFVTGASAKDRQAWATCTEVGEYAGRACPISPLDVLKQHPRVDFVDRADSQCLQTYGPLPPDLRALDRVVIVPAEGSVDSCIDDFAVQLFANPDGELVAVSLLQGEP